MPSPTRAELWSQLGNAAKVIDQIFAFGATNTPNYLTLEDTLIQDLEGDHANSVLQSLKAIRSKLNNSYLDGRSLLEPIIRNLLKIGYARPITGLSIDQILDDLADQMNTASETIESRGFTFGTVSAGGGNSSDGNIYRTTKDEFNNDLEAGLAGPIKLETVADKNSGTTPGNERLKIYGDGVGKTDELDLGATTDQTKNITFFRADNGLLTNASFDNIESSISNAEQRGWTLSNTANFTKITESTSPSDIFRYTAGQERSTSPKGSSLQFDDNAWLAQYVGRQGNITFAKDAPYFLICRYMRKNSADGTLQLRLGSQTKSASLTAATNDVWNDLIIGPDEDKGWYEVFKEDWPNTAESPTINLGVRVRLDLTGRTTGEVIIDEIVLAKAIPFNGLFYLPVAGSASGDSLVGDTWTYSNTSSENGRNQYTIARLFKKHLPHTASPGETYSDA